MAACRQPRRLWPFYSGVAANPASQRRDCRRQPGIWQGQIVHCAVSHGRAAKCCGLRAVSTNDNAHSSSGYWMLTGYPHQPTNVENATPGAPNDWPCLGAMVRRLRPGNGTLPASVTLPEHIWNTGGIVWPGQNAGFLGRTADPWLMMCDPSAPDFQVPELGLAMEVPPLRLQERRSLLQQVNTHLDTLDRSSALARYDNQTRQVFDLLRSPRARKAFNLQL